MSPSKSFIHVVLPWLAVFVGLMLPGKLANAQSGYTWEQIKSKFETANLALQADEINVQEMKAQEITAYLRPNPQLTLSADGTQIAPHEGIWRPLSGTALLSSFSYLHERDNKRELRLQVHKRVRR
ncbi:hypothetical protein [Acidobacterium sp. S8]|uniref:hypothetical protein n=1 Tax=Acidobacterium sp. S8 TaxID=1641854 RepID=UPI001C20A560|nr:hypothetical protein [Acidobacterium sp. S8]